MQVCYWYCCCFLWRCISGHVNEARTREEVLNYSSNRIALWPVVVAVVIVLLAIHSQTSSCDVSSMCFYGSLLLNDDNHERERKRER